MIIYPTVIYHKRHSITGLNYFGKTTRDPYKYNGSGTYWKKHIKKHGTKYVETLWVSEIYIDSDFISDYALKFSKDNNIVESKEWANLVEENGLDGGSTGRIVSEETRAKIGAGNTGKTHSDETIAKMTGMPKSDEHRVNISTALTGYTRSVESIAKQSNTNTKLHDILTPDGIVLEQISTKELCSRFNLNYGTVSKYFWQNRAYKGFLKI